MLGITMLIVAAIVVPFGVDGVRGFFTTFR